MYRVPSSNTILDSRVLGGSDLGSDRIGIMHLIVLYSVRRKYFVSVSVVLAAYWVDMS